jgi:SPP1 family predicted phage head-tail adaptor
MPLQAGKLDRRICIKRNYPTKDGYNADVDDWRELATVWAARLNISDGERFRAGETMATLSARFQIRWSPSVADVDPRDRIVFEGRTFDIAGVKELGRREGLEITAAARAETPSA